MTPSERRKRVPPRNVWLWWCADCQCNKTRPCPDHMLLLSDAEVRAFCIKYTRGNVYGTGRRPARGKRR